MFLFVYQNRLKKLYLFSDRPMVSSKHFDDFTIVFVALMLSDSCLNVLKFAYVPLYLAPTLV